MKYYYALFNKNEDAIEVLFPDLEGCVTFGSDWDEAFNNAVDVLGAWLAHAEPQFIKAPSSHEDLESLKSKGMLIPIPVDDKIIESYQQLKRINAIFPREILKEIDSYRKTVGLKRSAFLVRASIEYLKHHKISKKRKAG